MKIIENNNIYLEVANRNRQYLGRLLLALPFVAVGLGLMLATVEATSLECQRQTDKSVICQRTIASILGEKEDGIPGNLRSVKVDKNGGIGIVLGTSKGDVKLAPYRTFVNGEHDRNADLINAFLKDTQQTTLSVEQDDRLINSLWSGSILIGGLAIGLLAMAVPVRMSCKLDRLRDRAIIDKQYFLLGNRQTVLTLSAIERAQVRESVFVRNRQPVYSIDLVSANSKNVSLSITGKNLAEYEQIVEEIERFIKK
ncbi:hypothetical protein [Chamaesiphon minutus]|uniref:Uncharacterized protein n=1 Tax=Chamaesiphon minutus (strain ATCC 27169 / PCC 6605) TaxID=1173020 RepID=K9UB17_CHAP6|nr:hypothetical protein [Chamaesiphon minutus]AFY92040.1 hypothetical protein Cha6605_0772 [Chamaesiphon minutus PCC 6605]